MSFYQEKTSQWNKNAGIFFENAVKTNFKAIRNILHLSLSTKTSALKPECQNIWKDQTLEKQFDLSESNLTTGFESND